jgi:hypothetical protein
MCSIGLNFEYSRMHFPSLSSGCEIAQFFVRHTAFHVQRLSTLPPKRRFGKDEQKMKSRFSIYFSMVSSPNRVLTPLKSASVEIRIVSFVPPSQIFVGGGEINLSIWVILRCSFVVIDCSIRVMIRPMYESATFLLATIMKCGMV